MPSGDSKSWTIMPVTVQRSSTRWRSTLRNGAGSIKTRTRVATSPRDASTSNASVIPPVSLRCVTHSQSSQKRRDSAEETRQDGCPNG